MVKEMINDTLIKFNKEKSGQRYYKKLHNSNEVRSVWHQDQQYYSIIDAVKVIMPALDEKHWNNIKTEKPELSKFYKQLDFKSSTGKLLYTDYANKENLQHIIQCLLKFLSNLQLMDSLEKATSASGQLQPFIFGVLAPIENLIEKTLLDRDADLTPDEFVRFQFVKWKRVYRSNYYASNAESFEHLVDDLTQQNTEK